jgi:tetratricopeptide (TPR) repeat protein
MQTIEQVRLHSVALVSVLTGLLALVWATAADEPPLKLEAKPPWQRMLQGEDAKQVGKLQKQIDEMAEGGKLAQAIQTAKELLALREQRQGTDHWQAADARQQIKTLERRAAFTEEQRADYRRAETAWREAMDLFAKGRHAQAQPLCEQVLALRRKLLGEEHPDTATAYTSLAHSLRSQGKHAEAEAAYRKALDLRRQLLGEEHPETATSYHNLASQSWLLGKDAEAEEGLRHALRLRLKLLGEEHADIAYNYYDLALTLNTPGRYPEAEQHYRKALALYRKLRGEEHLETVGSYMGLASNLHAQGKYAEAGAVSLEALALTRKLFSEEHPWTAICYNNLGNNQSDQGKYAEAEENLRKALPLYRKLFGEEDPRTAGCYNNLAMSLVGQGKYAEAEENLRQILALYRKLRREEHPVTAYCYNTLSASLMRQDKYAEAEEAGRKALDLRRKQLGEQHPDTAVSYSTLAISLDMQGKYADAGEFLQRAVEVHRKVLGDEHPNSALLYQNLAYNLAARQRDREAEAQLALAADAFTHARPQFASSGLERAAGVGERSPMPFLAALLARRGEPELAWQRFEQGLGRGTWDDLTARLARSPQEQDRLVALGGRLERLDLVLQEYGTLKQPTEEQSREHKERLTQRRGTQQQLDALTRELAQKYGVAEAHAYALEKVQAALPADTALLGWVDIQPEGKIREVVKERWALRLRAKGKPTWVPLKGSGKDDAWTDADSRLPGQLAADLHSRPRSEQADWRPLARRLYQQRLEPLAPQLAATADLPAVRHLIVLPSDVMDGIPLEVLTERYVFSRAPSATVFAFLRGKAKPQTEGLLALADPVFDRPDTAAKPAPLPPGGVLLVAVVPGSNASQAGLRSGDVLLRYKDTALKTAADLGTQVQAAGADPKAHIPIEVWREGEKDPLKMEVPPGPLGVSVAKEAAPEAVAKRRRIDAETVASRGDGDWKALPGTRAEAEAIARRFRDARKSVTLLTDSDASEQRLAELAGDGTLGKVRYLHLATHGTVNRDFPLQSAVILARDRLPDPAKQLDAGSPVYDGRLTAAEVLRDWNLDADLVTLSACETGLGRYARGEGYMGFAQALLIAGSRSVCLSLWPVDDAATALLMDRFYANLLGQRDGLKGPLGKAEALDEAKKWLRALPRKEAVKLAAVLTGGVERGKGRPALPKAPAVPETATEDEPPYAHPYYWAAFVLIGDTD